MDRIEEDRNGAFAFETWLGLEVGSNRGRKLSYPFLEAHRG